MEPVKLVSGEVSVLDRADVDTDSADDLPTQLAPHPVGSLEQGDLRPVDVLAELPRGGEAADASADDQVSHPVTQPRGRSTAGTRSG